MAAICRIIALMTGLTLAAFSAPALAAGCVDAVDKQVTFKDGKFSGPVERIADYIAVIGERDLVNDKGDQLKDFRAIIQRDRENLHVKGAADSFGSITDQREDYFTTPESRKMLARAEYYFYCYNKADDIAELRKSIVSGKVPGLLWVVIFRHPNDRLAVFLSVAG